MLTLSHKYAGTPAQEELKLQFKVLLHGNVTRTMEIHNCLNTRDVQSLHI
jgi:hypothetical protein